MLKLNKVNFCEIDRFILNLLLFSSLIIYSIKDFKFINLTG